MCLGIPGRIISIDDPSVDLATVDVCGVRRRINISCVLDDRPHEACIGEWVLVHVGFAMSRIDEAEAERTLQLLDELAEAEAEMRALAGSGEEA
jgi:hydrogenase expression/formation protein HypC